MSPVSPDSHVEARTPTGTVLGDAAFKDVINLNEVTRVARVQADCTLVEGQGETQTRTEGQPGEDTGKGGQESSLGRHPDLRPPGSRTLRSQSWFRRPRPWEQAL